MESLPGYDNWKTTPPEPEFYATYCDRCEDEFSADDQHEEGDECPTCGGSLLELDPPAPCHCGEFCYC